MKCAVVGPGALGCLLAASLGSVCDQPVWLVDHNEERAQLLRQQGVVVEKGGRSERFAVRATADPAQVGFADLVLFCVKSTAVATTLNHIRPMMAEKSLLLAFQNGISHLEELKAFGLPGAWAVAVTAMGATLLGPGRVRFGGSGLTRLGWVGAGCGKSAFGLQGAADLLARTGMAVRVEPEILSHVWNKLLVNVGINGLTALYQCPNGGLLAHPEAMARMRAAVEEAAMVARAQGIAITADPVALTMEVCKATSANISSMLQDVRKGRATEISAINGAVVAIAKDLGISVPANERILAEIKSLEISYLPYFP